LEIVNSFIRDECRIWIYCSFLGYDIMNISEFSDEDLLDEFKNRGYKIEFVNLQRLKIGGVSFEFTKSA